MLIDLHMSLTLLLHDAIQIQYAAKKSMSHEQTWCVCACAFKLSTHARSLIRMMKIMMCVLTSFKQLLYSINVELVYVGLKCVIYRKKYLWLTGRTGPGGVTPRRSVLVFGLGAGWHH